jgi:hypothetical protein
VIARWGFAGLTVAKAVLVGPIIGFVLIYPAFWPALAILCLPYAYAVWKNARAMRRTAGKAPTSGDRT